MKVIGRKFSRAEVTGITMLSLAAAVFFVNPPAAAAIAFLFIVLCVLGCFFPQMNFLLPVITRGNSGRNYVSLTFDDGPSATMTPRVLALLDQYGVKATFFVSGARALRYPEILAEIIGRGHAVGNHSYGHSPFLMLKGHRALRWEIAAAQDVLHQAGIHTLVFRPPVGIVNPKLPRVLDDLQMFCMTFSCRAGDAGNRLVKTISKKILNKIRPDDIILLHDVPAGNSRLNDIFLQEVEKLLQGIESRGFVIVPLDQLIGRPIMSQK